MKISATVLLLFAVGVQAQTASWWTGNVYWFDGKPVNAKVLTREIEDLDHEVEIVSCSGRRCRVAISTDTALTQSQKDGIEQAVVDHVKRDFKSRRNALKAIAQDLKNKPSKTPLERLILYLLRRDGLGE